MKNETQKILGNCIHSWFIQNCKTVISFTAGNSYEDADIKPGRRKHFDESPYKKTSSQSKVASVEMNVDDYKPKIKALKDKDR